MSTGSARDTAYRILDTESVLALLARLADVRVLLGGEASRWRIVEVGDGNLNLVFIVEGPDGSVCVKQALPYVRAAGPSWPMSLERAFYENAYYRAVAPHVGNLIPQIYHYDPELYCTIMERLSPHIILRHGLIAGRRFPEASRRVAEYIAAACFFTSDLALPLERKLDGVALFAGNQALLRITAELVFSDPYRNCERNRHTTPQLDALVAELRSDGALKSAAAFYGNSFLTRSQALLHGDLHSGSLMVTEHDTRIIDPEFALYGPIGFDLGAFFANLLLSYFSQPGHASATDDRFAQQAWILEQTKTFWDSFRRRFLALWTKHAGGDAFPVAMFSRDDQSVLLVAREAYMAELFSDMIGFAACKMIRRVVGFAHVIDFDLISDPWLRSTCEARTLELARQMLTSPERFRSVDDVVAAARR